MNVCLVPGCRCEFFEWDDDDDDVLVAACVCGHMDDEHGEPEEGE